jgi:flagellar biosynthesis protein FlhF
MRIRRFTGPDTATALRKVKEALGAEAVILQTRPRREGGVEITAAVDAELVTRPIAGGPPATTPELADLARELREIGQHLRALDRAVRPPAPALAALGPEAWALAERLSLHGLAADLAAPIAATFESARHEGAGATAALEDSLARHLTSAPRTARITAFVGPTGAGKTTTIAKLAARDVATAGRKVGLVMADGIRVGAREQLETYARLLDVPMRVVGDGDELRAALAEFTDRDAVYVDTAGLGGDPQEAAALERLLGGAGEPVARTAVVSAGASEAALRAAWRQLGAVAPESCVVTKVDEGAGLGSACSWLHERGLALAWLGVGQRVPEDLTAPSGGELARWLVAA